MGKSIFKKNMIIILGVALMCAGIIVYSFVRSYNTMNSFVQSGYVHTDPTVSENKKLLFVEGEKYHPSLNNRIKFNDINDFERVIDSKSFIHYDNDSIASFSEGVIVDLNELNEGSTMSHYHMSANTSIEKQGASYVAIANGQEITFTDFVWKVGENKYLVISSSILATLSDEDARDVGSYAEVTYLDDNVIQIQTEDNIWQTISKNCSLQTANGSVIDLPMKNIKDSDDNVLLDFNKMVVDSNDNVEIAPLTEDEKALTNNIIPHFTVETEEGDPGLSGTTGTPGLIGSDGNYGVAGLQGNEGDSESADDTILKFPVFSVKDWNVTASSCTGKVSVKDEEGMIQSETSELFGQLYLVDLASGSKIYLFPSAGPGQYDFKGAAESETNIDFTFSGLKTDHSYMLCVSAPLKPDEETDTYSRMFITKTFWTDSLGVYMEAGEIKTDSVSVVINRDGNTSGTVYRLERLFDTYDSAAQVTLASLQSNMSSLAPVNNSTHEIVTYVNEAGDNYYKSNSSYYSILAFDLNGDNTLDDYSTQILELKTLKQPASIGSPILKANRNNWGFDITPGSINDPDGGITKYVYEFFDADQFTSSGLLIDNPVICKTITTTSSSPFSISLDGVSLKANIAYRVRATAYFEDNVKTYTLVSGFSSEAQLDGATKPKVYFDTGTSSGVSTTATYYDTITGTLHIDPGTDGAKLIIDSDRRANPTKVTIKDSSSYSRTYNVYPVNETLGKTKGDYLIGIVNDNGDVSIAFNDYESKKYSWVSGLKPDRDYEISVTGDLSEDGVNLIELNAEVGKCSVKTNLLEEFTVYSSYEGDNNTEPLKNFRVGIPTTTTAEFNRQRATLYGIEVNVYSGDQTLVDTLPTPIASKAYTKDDKWINSNGNEVWMYYDTDSYPNGTYVLKVLNTMGGYEYYLSNQFGDISGEGPITEGGALLTEAMIMSSPSKNIVQLSVVDRLFTGQYSAVTLADGTTDHVVTDGGLLISADDFDESQKNAIINVSEAGVTVVINKIFDYTYNNDDHCKNNQQPTRYVNEMDFVGETKTYVQFSQDISDIILTRPFAKLERGTNNYVDYYYLLQAQFTNKGFLAEQITYYVFDAVDFYKGSYTRSSLSESELLTFVNGSSTASSFLITNGGYACPVLDESKILAKKTVDMNTSLIAPTVVFYPYTKQSYKDRNGVPDAPEKLSGTGYDIMYLPDGSDAGTYGHQYVFCWTLNYHAYNATNPLDTSEKLVYPFDASVKCKLSNNLGSHVANVLDTYKFSDFANTASIKNRVFDIQGAYWNNGSKKYGEGCYMLLPHEEKRTDAPVLCDEPIPDPTTYAVQYSSDDSSVTMRTFVVDYNGAVYQSSPGSGSLPAKCHPYLLKSTTGGSVTAERMSNEVVIKKLFHEPNTLDAVTDLMSNDSNKRTEINITRTVAQNAPNFYDSTTGTGSSVLLVPIQKYTNKYTNNGDSIHVDGSYYVSGSSDGNWTFNPSSKNKYYELLTAYFDKVYDYKTAINGHYYKYVPQTGGGYTTDGTKIPTEDTQAIDGKAYYDSTGDPIPTPIGKVNPHEEGYHEDLYTSGAGNYKRVEVVKLQKDVKIDLYENIGGTGDNSYSVHLYGPEEQIKEAVGVRFTIGEPDGHQLKIDKYLSPSVSPTDNNDIRIPGTPVDNTNQIRVEGGKVHIYFKIDIEMDLSARVQEFGNDNFAGQTDVPISACLLYETNSSGLGILGAFKTTKNDTYFSKTNEITYTLKRAHTISNPGSGITYLTIDNITYVAYTSRNDQLSASETYYEGNGIALNKFGSFFQMYGGTSSTEGSAFIQVRSTRYWNSNTQKVSQTFNPKIDPTRDGQYFYPAEVVEGGKVMLRKYINEPPSPHYSEEASQIYFETGSVEKSISNYSDEIVRNKATISYMLHSVAATDNIYFTITKGESSVATSGSATNQAIHLVYDSEAGYYKVASGYSIIGSSFFTPTSQSNADTYLNTYSSDPDIKKAFIKTTGDISQLDIRGLDYNQSYTITCWEWKNIGDGYRFVQLNMPRTSGEGNEPNHYSFTIGNLEVPSDTDIDAGWFVNSYDDKGIKYGFIGEMFDTDTMYYVVDLYDDDNNLLTHLYASDSKNVFYFDADTLNPDPNYKKIYRDPSIGHDDDNHITFGSSTPDNYCEDLKYGGSYSLNLRIYEKGTGPAWKTDYNYDSDYDNILRVFTKDPNGNPEALIPDKSGERKDEFVINGDEDVSSGIISSTIEVNGTSAASYITFIVPGINHNSYSIRYSKFTPVVIREHVSGSNTTYYDVTKDLLSNGPSGMLSYNTMNGIYNFGQSLRLDINKTQNSGASYTDKYEVGDVIHIFIYSYQDDRAGKVALDSDNLLINLTPSNILGTRYTVKEANTPLMDSSEFSELTNVYVGGSSSRLMGRWQRTVTSAEINAGKVTVTLTDFPMGEDTANILSINFREASGVTSFTKIEYLITFSSVTTTIMGTTPNAEFTWPVQSYNLNLTQTQTSSALINITDIMNAFNNAMGENSQITKMTVSLKVYDNKTPTPEPIKFTEDPGDTKAHLSPDQTTLTYEIDNPVQY